MSELSTRLASRRSMRSANTRFKRSRCRANRSSKAGRSSLPTRISSCRVFPGQFNHVKSRQKSNPKSKTIDTFLHKPDGPSPVRFFVLSRLLTNPVSIDAGRKNASGVTGTGKGKGKVANALTGTIPAPFSINNLPHAALIRRSNPVRGRCETSVRKVYNTY